jgi:exopolyphosphatase/guanosine-5'-triphosphate,3'-diphosphate pyrophosphatase
VRDAANREDFSRVVRETTGVEMELIDGHKEAELSFLGGTRGLDTADGPFLVLDIGGGSTELVVGDAPGAPAASISTQIGSVRMTERYLRSDPPSEGELRTMDEAIEQVLVEAEDALPLLDVRTFVAVGGTATTLRAIDLDLPRYDPDRIHRTWLSLDSASRITSNLARMTVAERSSIPVMAPGRGPVIVAGASILLAVMRRSGSERVLASETDILDGLAWELLDVG